MKFRVLSTRNMPRFWHAQSLACSTVHSAINYYQAYGSWHMSHMNPSTGSAEFKELSLDFFLHQVNIYPTRQNHILHLVLTSASENIGNLSCIPPSTIGISTDHNLLFFDLLLYVKSTGCDRRTVFDFQHADWNALHETLSHLDLAPGDSTNIDADWTKWKDLFLGAAAKHILNIFFKRKTKQKSCSSLWEKYRELRRKTKSIIYAKRKC